MDRINSPALCRSTVTVSDTATMFLNVNRCCQGKHNKNPHYDHNTSICESNLKDYFLHLLYAQKNKTLSVIIKYNEKEKENDNL